MAWARSWIGPTVFDVGHRYDDHHTVAGKVIRVRGQGLLRVDETKSAAGRRTIPLPKFAVEMLQKRRHLPYLGEQTVIFPSTAGSLRDPNNFLKLWRSAREELGVPDATTNRHRPPRPQPRQHDPGPLDDPRPHPHPGGRPAGPRSSHKR
jgi:hypothetical protein